MTSLFFAGTGLGHFLTNAGIEPGEKLPGRYRVNFQLRRCLTSQDAMQLFNYRAGVLW